MTSKPNFKRAVKAAYRIRKQYDTGGVRFDPFIPISVEKRFAVCRYTTYCERHGLEIGAFLRSVSSDGFALRRGSKFIIVYNDAAYIPETRKRFTLAHELGHCILGHTGEGENEEAEADCFARNLLAPRLLALELDIGFPDYPMAFGISAAAARMCYRFRELDEHLAK